MQKSVEEPLKETAQEVPGLEAFSSKPDFSTKSRFKTAPKTTVKLNDLLKVEVKKDQGTNAVEQAPVLNEPFTPEELLRVWREFAEQRRNFQAEFQLLSQPYTLKDKHIIVSLVSPVHDTLLNNLKVELSGYLREKLRNSLITLTGEYQIIEDKKVIYTNREKFEYLADKNPVLNDLRDRLGLDTDF